MRETISLKELEHRMYRTTFQDGLTDIFLGSVISMFAVAPLLNGYLGDFWSSVLFLPFWGVLSLVLRKIRDNQVIPRIGEVRFGKWRKKRLLTFSILLAVFNVAALVLGILVWIHFDSLPAWLNPLPFSLLALFGFSAAAFLLQIRRLFFYGLMIALAPLVGEVLYSTLQIPHHGFPITFGITAAVITGCGLFLLFHLLNTIPLPPQEFTEEN